VFRKNRDTDPTEWDGKTYEYKPTSTTMLRGHLKREHLDNYLKTSKEKGWKQHSMFNSKASQAATLATSSLERPDRFSEETFHRFLVRFIVADNQVGSPPTLVTALMFSYF
jgi:hypothetical protein